MNLKVLDGVHRLQFLSALIFINFFCQIQALSLFLAHTTYKQQEKYVLWRLSSSHTLKKVQCDPFLLNFRTKFLKIYILFSVHQLQGQALEANSLVGSSEGHESISKQPCPQMHQRQQETFLLINNCRTELVEQRWEGIQKKLLEQFIET